MNNLEWIDAEIAKWQEILESFKEQLIQVKGTRNEQTTLNHIEFYKLRLKYLHQIKTELEAWEVVKKNFHIQAINRFNKIPGILIQTLDEEILQNVDFEEYEKLKKALEVKENE